MIKTILKKFLEILLLFFIDSCFMLFFHSNYFSLLSIVFLNALENKNNNFIDISINLLFMLLFLILFYYNNIMMLVTPFYFILLYKYIHNYLVYTKNRYLIIKLIAYLIFITLIDIKAINIYIYLLNTILLLLF
jgi:hypothetical protein